MVDDTPRDPVDALGAVVANYLRSMGVQLVVLEMDDDNHVAFDLEDAMHATNVLPVLTAAAEQIYRSAGLDVAAARWPIALVRGQSALMGVEATWIIEGGSATWGAVFPCILEAANVLFQRSEEDPATVHLNRQVLVELETALHPTQDSKTD